jgi:hypothetical protein
MSLRQVGQVLITLATPLTVYSFGVLVVQAPSIAAGLAAAVAVTTGPLGAGGDLGWLLHVGVLGLLAGVWIYGLALVVEELSRAA